MLTMTLTVNDRPVTVDVPAQTLLVDLLRDHLRLTGTHIGCHSGHCGACVVLLDGISVKSCCMLAVQAAGARVTTIEGLADGEVLHPMQQAFHEHHGLQCGYCTPGMVMSAIDLVSRNPQPSEAAVRDWLSGHLCRCTGYHFVVEAVRAGARAMAG